MELKKGKNPYRRLFWPNWRSILHDVCIVLHRRARNLMIWSMHNWMDFMHWPSENCDKLNTYALKGLHTLLPTGNIDCSTNNGVPLRKSNNVEKNLLFWTRIFPFCWERLQLARVIISDWNISRWIMKPLANDYQTLGCSFLWLGLWCKVTRWKIEKS